MQDQLVRHTDAYRASSRALGTRLMMTAACFVCGCLLAALPESVLLEAQAGMLNYAGSGLGVMEMSHRSADFEKIIADAEADCRKLLSDHSMEACR